MSEEVYKEVRFDIWCDTCKYKNLKESEDPCWDCLDDPVAAYSTKPTHWKEAEKTH